MRSFPIDLDIFRHGPGGRKFVARITLPEPGAYKIGRAVGNQIKLDFPDVSRFHAYLRVTSSGFSVLNRSTSGKTFIGNREVDQADWDGEKPLRLGPTVELVLAKGSVESLLQQSATQLTEKKAPEPLVPVVTPLVVAAPPPLPSQPATQAVQPAQPVSPVAPAVQPPPSHMVVELPDITTLRRDLDNQRKEADGEMKFPGELFNRPVVSVADLVQGGYVSGQCEYLTIGAGLGGFTWVDHLRVFGVPAAAIRAVGVHVQPYHNYRRLCGNSQIPAHERLRSNSISTPDNIWGFPGYASRETWRELKRLNLGGIKYVMQVFGEPAVAETYTPRIGDMWGSLEREMKRIGWREMMIPGRVVALRKTNDGRYALAYRVAEEDAGRGPRGQIVIARFVHIATGYPGTRFTPQLEDFKRRYPGDSQVAAAYAPHQHIYADLERNPRPAVIVVQGRGIVASRVLQRLFEARKENPQLQVVHLMRTPIGDREGSKWQRARRAVFNHTELQPFNWPKACWTGELRRDLDRAPPHVRAQMFKALGGTSTADRRDWIRIQRQGFAEGWYHVRFGNVSGIDYVNEERRKLSIVIDGHDKQKFTIVADGIIDCTGLVGDVREAPFLRDMMATYELRQNLNINNQPVGIAVTNDFEILGMQNLPGRCYAAGQITIGGPAAAVDSFLGLQYGALRSVDHLYEVGAPWVRRFGPFRSSGQWLKWCANARP